MRHDTDKPRECQRPLIQLLERYASCNSKSAGSSDQKKKSKPVGSQAPKQRYALMPESTYANNRREAIEDQTIALIFHHSDNNYLWAKAELPWMESGLFKTLDNQD